MKIRRPTVRWELLEHHLEEAEFLWTQWEQALWSPEFTLSEVSDGDEGRLLAHLDALVLGGPPAARRFLVPALASEEPARLAVATWVLLSSEDPSGHGAVFKSLEATPDEAGPGILRALELLARDDLHAAFLKRLPGLPPEVQAGIVRARRLQRLALPDTLNGDDALQAEVLRALPYVPRTALGDTQVKRALGHDSALVRDAALEVGLLFGSRDAWTVARERAASQEPTPRAGLLSLAVAGDSKDLADLVGRLADEQVREEVIWALGFSGKPAAAEALLPLLHDEDWGLLAASSFAAITGLPLAPPFILEELSEEDASEEEEDAEAPAPDDLRETLPGPRVLPGRVDAHAVEHWWAGRRASLIQTERYLRGTRLTAEGLATALETEPMRRRPALAWEVALRSGGALFIEPRLWSLSQRQQARTLVAQLTRGWNRLQSR
ncbi:TIGR02270 family protein [Myxococcus sp. CA033]|uniref:TIGR02270 family protein n=1 Tax=Myxococcus sp. CA033 TaxID=2741516 RepID=UPI00157AA43F|nr:TIGR02270 family protein [Myxococcus sp. CA033]